MEFIDLKSQYLRLQAPIRAAIDRVLEHGTFIMGPEVFTLESNLASFCGTKHCISCANGTDAILMALMQQGIGPGDFVYTTPFSFFATAEPIALLGATPVFVDVDPATFNLDPEQLVRVLDGPPSGQLAKANGDREGRARAVIAVDLFGLPADYEKLRAICSARGLTLIADGAQSFGARIDGVSPMALADIGTTSFFPAKPLGCYGDGGAIFTNDDEIAAKLRSIRVHGQGEHKYENVRLGVNGRLDTIQAAILIEKLAVFPDELEQRNALARLYDELLDGVPEIERLPARPKDVRSAWAQYTVVTRDESARESFAASLREHEIPTSIYYPNPIHLSRAMDYLGYQEGDFPVAEKLSRTVLSLPMSPDHDRAEVRTRLERALTRKRNAA